MATTLNEGDISFTFQGDAVKFDGTSFFRERFQKMSGGKGVDFLSAPSVDVVLFLEVKDCRGDEKNNLLRVIPDNRYRDKAPNRQQVLGRDSLDIEAVKKVASTIACLHGEWASAQSEKDSDDVCAAIWDGMLRRYCSRESVNLRVILFLEGEFGSDSSVKMPQWRTAKQIRRDLRKSIQDKLSWLPCTVEVADSGTYRQSSGYTVELHPHTV